MDTLTLIFSLLFALASGLYWGAYLSLWLPERRVWFDRRPFNCRPCLTFHLTWSVAALIALPIGSFILFVCGVVMAFIVFLIVKYIDSKSITK